MPRSKHSNLSCSRTLAAPEVCNNWGYDYTNNNTDMDTNMKNMELAGVQGVGSIDQSVVVSGEKTGFSVVNDW